ncbi:MAG TPA: hypothetical protein VD866_32220 [Urbifossiella sp.]|nr:hypothetical protein [Urbifossiella sp.]
MTLVVEVVLGEGKKRQAYRLRRRPDGMWSVWHDPMVKTDPYLVNPFAKTCNCKAGRNAKDCKHLTKVLELEQQMATATSPPSPPPPPAAPSTTQPAGVLVTASEPDLSAILIRGDLSSLSDAEKATYFMAVCRATGLNPATRPFAFIKTKNGVVLYANKAASDQLRKRDEISLRITDQREASDLYIVTVEASTPGGRVDTDVGAVALGKLTGDDRANAILKAITKAKRRATLSICGLGMLDETEVETMRVVETTPGESSAPAPVVTVSPPPPPPPPPVAQQMTDLDRAAFREIATNVATELGITAVVFAASLEKAYGKRAVPDLTDAELTDLVNRLQSKKKAA